jgi:hypothetical protein
VEFGSTTTTSEDRLTKPFEGTGNMLRAKVRARGEALEKRGRTDERDLSLEPKKRVRGVVLE